jgi:hypothetical protein
MFRRCQDLVDRWEVRVRDGERPRRLLCVESRLRLTAACGFLPARPTPMPPEVREDRSMNVDSDGEGIPGRSGWTHRHGDGNHPVSHRHRDWNRPVRQFLRAHPDRGLEEAQRLLDNPGR